MVLGQEVNTLIFDFDGTLFHLPVDWAAVRSELGLAAGAKLGGLLQRLMDDADDAALTVVTRYELAAVPAGSFTAGAEAALRSRANVAIVTRNSRKAVLAALGALAGDIVVFGREDVRRLKPDPDGLLKAMAHFGARPERTAMVGDTFHDVEAARSAGVRSVIVRNELLEYAPAGADHYVDDLGQLSNDIDLGGDLRITLTDRQ